MANAGTMTGSLMATGEKFAPHLLVLAGAGSLGFAFFAQYGMGLEPCILCLYQRIPYAAAVVLGVVGILIPRFVPALLLVAGLAFTGGAATAFYHVGVEQHWWQSAAGCGGSAPAKLSVSDLHKQLTVKPEKACDEVDWALFGISMATYNVPYSGGLALLAFAGWSRTRRQS